jgi:hypothetical protein
MPDAQAMATPMAVSRLTATFTWRPSTDPVARDERASTSAATTSNSGYSTSSATASGPRCDAVVNITTAKTTANAKRATYSRRRADAVAGMAGAAVVVTVILSMLLAVDMWSADTAGELGGRTLTADPTLPARGGPPALHNRASPPTQLRA